MADKYDRAQLQALLAGEGDPQAQAWLSGSGSLDGLAMPMALAAVEAAVKQQAVSALQSLERAPKALRKAARKGLHRLRSQGVSVQEAAPAAAYSLGKEQITVKPVAILGAPDSEGYCEFVLAVTDHEGSCMLLGQFGGHQGLRKLQHAHLSRSELRRSVAEMRSQDAPMAELELLDLLSFVLPAAERARELAGRMPHEWEHFAEHLSEQQLAEARARQSLPPVELRPGLLAGSSVAVESPWFAWMPVSQTSLEGLVASLSRQVQDADDDSEEPISMAESLSRNAAAVLEDGTRQEWLRRARLAALATRARGEDHLATLAENLHQALVEGVPASEIPLAERALQLQLATMATAERLRRDSQ